MDLLNQIKSRGIVKVSRETDIDRRTLWLYQKGEQGMTLNMAEKLQRTYGGSVWQWWEMDAKKAAVKSEKEVYKWYTVKSDPADVTSDSFELSGSFRGRVWPGARVYVVGKSGDTNFPVHIQNKDGVDAYIKEDCLQRLDPIEHTYLYDGFGTPVEGFTAEFDEEEYKVLSMDWSLEVGAGWGYTLEDKEGGSFIVDAFEAAHLIKDIRYNGMLEDPSRNTDSETFTYGDLARYHGEPVIIKNILFHYDDEESVSGYLLEDGRKVEARCLTRYNPSDIPFVVNQLVEASPESYELEQGRYLVFSVDPYREQCLQIVSGDGTHYLCEEWEVISI